MGTHAENGENGFLRILLLEGDDVRAFVTQCELNNLERPCTLGRISNSTELWEKISRLNPNVILLGGNFASTDQVRELRTRGMTLPLVCIVEDSDSTRAAQLLKAGASDCIYSSQMHAVGECLEANLTGKKLPSPTYQGTSLIVPGAAIPLRHDWWNHDVAALWVKTRAALNGFSGQLQTFSRKCQHRFEEFIPVCKNFWRQIKVRYLVKIADTIARQKANPRKARPESFAASTPQFDNRRVYENSDIEPATERRNTGSGADPIEAPEEVYRDGEQPRRHHPMPQENSDEAIHSIELAFKALFHTSFDAIILVDNNGSILHANAAAALLFGVETASLLGMKFLSFAAPASVQSAESEWEMLLTLASHHGELPMLNAQGVLKNVEFRGRTNLWFGVHLLLFRETQAASPRVSSPPAGFMSAVDEMKKN